MRRAACLVLVLLLGGCLDSPSVMTDEEIHDRGLWTEKDAEARSLLDTYYGPGRAIRYVPYERKFSSVKGAVETITGMRYDKRYYYVSEEHLYVFPGRGDRPPVIVREDPDEEPPEPTAQP